ncbi:MAG: S1C family serine protease [Candidatus Komeilibacteria bacterium]|nr:S1C family serine protease [Candidatus Komeilibacteria bacterium]
MPKKEIVLPEKQTNNPEKRPLLEDIYQQHQMQRPSNAVATLSFKSFLLILLISVLGGFSAAIIQDSWFSVDYPSLGSDGRPSADNDKVLDLEFLLKEDSGGNSEVFAEIRKQIVGFYAVKKDAGAGILESLYLEKDFLGSGLVVTSDGWLLAPKSIAGGNNYAVVLSDKKVYQPDKVIEDEFSGLVLVHIAAQNLSPVKFASLNSILPTDSLLTARYSIQNHGSDLLKTSIQKFSYHDQAKPADFLLSTDKIDHYLKIAKDMPGVYNGAVLLNGKNEVAGLLFNSGRDLINLAVPSYYLRSAVNNFLVNSEKVMRSRLGASYVGLSESLGLSAEVNEDRVKGAVLLGDAKRSIMAVAENSPAAKAGLKAGDIILKVNNEDIDESNSLTKLIQDYKSGQEITLLISRQGKESEVRVVLEEL